MYLWKDSVERVVSHVDWLLHLGEHIPAHIHICQHTLHTMYFQRNTTPPAKLSELISEEHVGEEDLADDVGKVEELADKELEEVCISLGLLLVPVSTS